MGERVTSQGVLLGLFTDAPVAVVDNRVAIAGRNVQRVVWERLVELGDLVLSGGFLSLSDGGRLRRGDASVVVWPSLGPQIVDWMEANLVHGQGDLFGEPYRLADWMKSALFDMKRYDPETLVCPVKRVVVGIGKGNAKTEWAAACAIAEAAGPSVPTRSGLGAMRISPDVPIGAASRDQANLCFGFASAMISEGPLAPFFDVHQYEIRLKGRPGKIYRIAAEAGTQDGTLPTCFVADEVHEWQGSKARVHTVVTNSLAKRATGLEINISTAGDPELSTLLLGLYNYGVRVRSGEVVDPSFLFLWFEPSDPQVDLDDPVALRVALREANPSPWVDVERLAHRWEVEGISESVFRRYHLNQWVTSGVSFIGATVWDGLADFGIKVEPGVRVTVGFDGSYNGDTTALIGCVLGDTPHLFEVAVWEKPEGVRFWRVPRNEVDAAVESLFTGFDVVELVLDPARWSLYIDSWVQRYGDEKIVEYPNVVERMMPATAKFHDAALDGLFSHDGSVVLRRHVQNAVTKVHPRGYVIRKDHPDRKIDAAVAAVMAYDRATATVDTGPEVVVELW